MKLNERHCTLCEAEGREQIGGVYIVACKQRDCCNIIADETEADAYVAQLEERLKFQIEANDKLNNRRHKLEAKIAEYEREYREFVQALSKRDE